MNFRSFNLGMSAVFLTVLVVAWGCSDDDGPSWGIGHSKPETALEAQGTIDQQNAGPKVSYVVEEAFLTQTDHGLYLLRYRFESQDSISLIIDKNSGDYNYHNPQDSNDNELVSVIFNSDTLDLESGAVSIQPRKDVNKFSTVVNLHTIDYGDFNGTVEKVPLLK